MTAWNCDAGMDVSLARIKMTCEARLPSGIVTISCTRFFGLSSAAHARLACMCMCSL